MSICCPNGTTTLSSWAVGGRFRTVIGLLFEKLCPDLVVTVSLTSKLPLSAKTWQDEGPLGSHGCGRGETPSPKSQLQATISPEGLDRSPNCATRPSSAGEGAATKSTTGGAGPAHSAGRVT